MKLMQCKCKHSFQNEQFGKSVRAHNPCTKKPTPQKPGYKCTVCGSIKE
jgi:hypothetical protein